jgi:hypothetical protein
MATRRRLAEPPPLEIRQFTTPDEIRQGIAKLQRRIDEVRALETDQVHYNDQHRYTAEQNIRTTILEVFGENSPQFRADGHPRI